MPGPRITRRSVLALGGGVTVVGATEALRLGSAATSVDRPTAMRTVLGQHGSLPVDDIQALVGAQGLISDGVLDIDVRRDDLGEVAGPLGITFTGSFGLLGTLSFQPLGDDLAFFSGNLPVTAPEINPVIDAIIANDLIFQALHQPFVDMRPAIWSLGWRGVAAPLDLARAVHNVLRTTKTPLPQRLALGSQSPLDAEHLAEILHGGARIGGGGTVTVDVSRRDRIEIARVRIAPTSATPTSIAFKPRSVSGKLTDVAPNFSLRGSEIQSVLSEMRRRGWHISCLAHHETEESPQLYFAQMLKTGDAYALAGEIRHGLDRTDSAA